MRSSSASPPYGGFRVACAAARLLGCCLASLAASVVTVAADDLDSPNLIRPPQQEYRSTFDQEDVVAAVEAAESLVATARHDAETQPLALAEALSVLGEARFRADDLAGAEAAFAEALDLIEHWEGSASAHTLAPLRGLGFALARSGRHGEAIPHLDRALLISHRSHGLFHREQLPILKQLAISLTATGEALVAERHVNYMLRVGEQVHGKHQPAIVPLICSVADWHAITGNFDVARRHYRDAISIVERELGKDDVALVDPLRRLARSYVQEVDFIANGYVDPRDTSDQSSMAPPKPRIPRYISTDGQRALRRALALLESSPDAPPELTIDTLIDLGDWYQFKQEGHKALGYYRKAAQRLTDHNTTSAEALADPLAVPVRVYYPVPGVVIRGNRLAPFQAEDAYVELELTITPKGLVAEAKVTDESTSSRQAAQVLKAMRDARFRPKFIDGEPVETTGMTFREVLRVRKRDDRS